MPTISLYTVKLNIKSSIFMNTIMTIQRIKLNLIKHEIELNCAKFTTCNDKGGYWTKELLITTNNVYTYTMCINKNTLSTQKKFLRLFHFLLSICLRQ